MLKTVSADATPILLHFKGQCPASLQQHQLGALMVREAFDVLGALPHRGNRGGGY